jgi:hypothetical protein
MRIIERLPHLFAAFPAAALGLPPSAVFAVVSDLDALCLHGGARRWHYLPPATVGVPSDRDGSGGGGRGGRRMPSLSIFHFSQAAGSAVCDLDQSNQHP